MPIQTQAMRLLLVGSWLGMTCGIVSVTGCDNANPPQTATTNDHTPAQSTANTSQSAASSLAKSNRQPTLPYQSLDGVASVPVVDSINASSVTVTTSVSRTVAVPVNIQVNDNDSVAHIGELGHSTAGIAAASTMLDGIRQAIEEPNPDVAFIRSMLAHHEGAIALAQAELQYGTDDTLRKFAQDIIIMRSNEIRWMQNWLTSDTQHRPNHNDKNQTGKNAPTALQQEPQYTDGLKEMYQQMLTGINQPNPDIAFANSLIPHHKGAMAMAQVEFKYGNDDKARAFADNVIASQQSEITLLKDYLAHRVTANTDTLP